MLNKNDPLIGAVQEVMKKNQAEREAAKLVNEKFGVHDRKALPHEKQGEWDAAYKTVLTEGAEALDEAKLSPEHKSVITQKLQKIHGKGKVKFGPNGATWSDGIDQRTHDVTVNKSGKVKMDSSPYLESELEEEALDEKVKMTKKEFANLDGDPKFTANDLAHARAGTHKKKAASGELEENNLDEAGMMPTGINKVLARLKAGRLADKYNNIALGDDPYQRTPPKNYKKDIEQAIKYRRIENRLKGKKETVEEMMNPTSAPTSQTPANVVRKAAVKQNVRMGGNPTGAASSQTPASTVRKAAVKQNVRMGGNPTGSPVRPSSSKGPMEEDVTSPSGMGIKGPDYAPAGTKPDYAVRKTVGTKSDLIKKPTMSSGNSTVTQTGKTSSSATKSTMKESNLQEKAVSKAQHRFFGLVRGIQKGEAHGSAKAEKAAREMSAKSVRDYAKTSERGLPEKVSEAMDQPQIRGQSNVAGARLSGSFTTQGALPRPPKPAIDSAPRPQQASPMMGQGAPGIKRQPGGARPSVVAKNTPTTSAAAKEVAGARLSGSFTTQGALPQKPASAAKTGPSFERTGRGGSPSMAPKPADRPNDLGKAGVPGTGGKLAPAAAPKPTAKPVQAVKKPAAAAPVKNASTRGGTMSQSDANVLAKVRAGGGQKLSKTLPSGRERLKFFAARNAERRGP